MTAAGVFAKMEVYKFTAAAMIGILGNCTCSSFIFIFIWLHSPTRALFQQTSSSLDSFILKGQLTWFIALTFNCTRLSGEALL